MFLIGPGHGKASDVVKFTKNDSLMQLKCFCKIAFKSQKKTNRYQCVWHLVEEFHSPALSRLEVPSDTFHQSDQPILVEGGFGSQQGLAIEFVEQIIFEAPDHRVVLSSEGISAPCTNSP